MPKILFAMGNEDAEEAILSKLDRSYSKVGTVNYREAISPRLKESFPDIVLISDDLQGNTPTAEILYEIRMHYPTTRIILVGTAKSPDHPLIQTCIMLSLFDFLMNDTISILDIIKLIKKPKEITDIRDFIPKVSQYKVSDRLNIGQDEYPADVKNMGENVLTGELQDIDHGKFEADSRLTKEDRVIRRNATKKTGYQPLVKPAKIRLGTDVKPKTQKEIDLNAKNSKDELSDNGPQNIELMSEPSNFAERNHFSKKIVFENETKHQETVKSSSIVKNELKTEIENGQDLNELDQLNESQMDALTEKIAERVFLKMQKSSSTGLKSTDHLLNNVDEDHMNSQKVDKSMGKDLGKVEGIDEIVIHSKTKVDTNRVELERDTIQNHVEARTHDIKVDVQNETTLEKEPSEDINTNEDINASEGESEKAESEEPIVLRPKKNLSQILKDKKDRELAALRNSEVKEEISKEDKVNVNEKETGDADEDIFATSPEMIALLGGTSNPNPIVKSTQQSVKNQGVKSKTENKSKYGKEQSLEKKKEGRTNDKSFENSPTNRQDKATSVNNADKNLILPKKSGNEIDNIVSAPLPIGKDNIENLCEYKIPNPFFKVPNELRIDKLTFNNNLISSFLFIQANSQDFCTAFNVAVYLASKGVLVTYLEGNKYSSVFNFVKEENGELSWVTKKYLSDAVIKNLTILKNSKENFEKSKGKSVLITNVVLNRETEKLSESYQNNILLTEQTKMLLPQISLKVSHMKIAAVCIENYESGLTSLKTIKSEISTLKVIRCYETRSECYSSLIQNVPHQFRAGEMQEDFERKFKELIFYFSKEGGALNEQ